MWLDTTPYVVHNEAMTTHNPDLKQYLLETYARRLTSQDMADALGVSRSTITRKLTDGLLIEDVIEICRYAGVPPVVVLVDMGYLDERDVWDAYVRPNLQTASDQEILDELQRRLAGGMSRG